MKTDDLETLAAALELARRIIGKYIEPGPRDADNTINQVLAVLDDQDVVKALDHLKRRRTIR